jgi:transposase InsO family protein
MNQNNFKELELPIIESSKVTPERISRVNAFVRFINTTRDIDATQKDIAQELKLSAVTMRWYCARIRKMFSLPARTPLASIAQHPQLRQALESLFVRKERADKLTLCSGKRLSVILPTNGELLQLEEFLKTIYANEGMTSIDCYLSMRARCVKKQVLIDDTNPACIEDLPAEATVRSFLRRWRKSCIAARRARSREKDWNDTQQPYVTRKNDEYKPGEMWFGDHTELDFAYINDEGKIDYLWMTANIDMGSRVLLGYVLADTPSSNTIAAAIRNSITSSQLKAFTGTSYEPLHITNMCDTLTIDNGKDYRSKHLQRFFGKIDFTDVARQALQRITKVNYTLKYHGQSKGPQERWFRTIQGMLKCLQGYKGNKYDKKPDTLKNDIAQGLIPTREQLTAMIALAVNTYNNKPHSALKGQTPIQYYLTHQIQQRSIDLRVLDFLLMKVKRNNGQPIKIRHSQVLIYGEEYYSQLLFDHNDKHADVYYDPNDLGMVVVYVDNKFVAVASNKNMFGQSENGWKKILHDRTSNDKRLKNRVKEIRGSVSSFDARMMALEGQLLNMNPVSRELLQKNPVSINYLTGLEDQAREVSKELEREKVLVENKKKRDAKPSVLSLATVNDRIK